MQIRLPQNRRPVVTVFGAAVFGALLAGAGPQVTNNLADRPACAEKVMSAVASDRPVSGAYNCFDTGMQVGLASLGIQSDGEFALRVGQNGDYHFVQKTVDGGYVYEYDRPTRPHDKVQGALGALGVPGTSRDLRRGDLAAAWNERHDLGAAWAEITGATQKAKSSVFTFYMDGRGKVTAIK
jgi:hypothetical protein